MGRMHLGAWSKCEDAKVVAICDANPDILKESDTIVGNIEGLPEKFDFSRIHFYSDYEQMLKSEQLDAVSITLPTYLHAEFSVKALQAGINVLCEKPMALTLKQCDTMIAAAQGSDKELMIAHCIRFWPEYAWIKQIIESGQYGRVQAATFQRLGTAPVWSSDNWLLDNTRSGGMVLDLHIHDTDYVHYVFGIPKAVCSHGTVIENGIRHILTQYDYGNGLMVTAEGSWLMAPSFGFEMSFNIVLENATIVYDCSRQPMFRVCPVDGEAFTPDVETRDGYILEIAHFIDRIHGTATDEILTLAQSKDSVRIIKAEQQSVLENRKIEIE